MNQLYIDDNGKIFELPLNIPITMDDMDDDFLKFINDTNDNLVIYISSLNKFLCSKCLMELNKDKTCPICNKKFAFINENSNNVISYIEKDYLYYFSNTINYHFYSIINNNVYLYVISSDIYYDKNSFFPPRKIDTKIDSIFHIFKEYTIDYIKKKKYLYKDIDNVFRKVNNDSRIYETFNNVWADKNYLYMDNLDLLKDNDLFKYSFIWDLKEYLKDGNFVLNSLITFPVFYRQFEYLIKMRLYNLALFYSYGIKLSSNFKDAFGIDRKYLPFMQAINIKFTEFESLKLYPTFDKEVLDIINKYYSYYVELLDMCNIDLKKVINYIKNQNLDDEFIVEYVDYIKMCLDKGFDLTDKKILFPKNLMLEHNRLIEEIEISKDKNVDKEISNLSKLYSFNNYSDSKYVIFPASSVASIIDESYQQFNCVRTYIPMVSNNNCQIYFLRKKDNITKSYVTVEVRNNKIVQARTKFNKIPDKDVMEFLSNWEKTLLLVTTDN